MDTPETDYQRAWRERGEVEEALRKWRRNRSSPAFTKGVAIMAVLVSGGIIGAFIADPSRSAAPVLFFAALFGALPFLTPSILRDEAKARAEAKATLEKFGLWDRVR